MIRCRDLTSGYRGRAVLDRLSLEVAAGEMVGILGPNGAGKTTLLMALSGVLSPGAGTVALAGRDLAELSDRQRARLVAAVPQRGENAGELAVRSVVLMGRYPYLGFLGGYGPQDHQAAEAAMEAVGLGYLADRRLHELSGGEFQRVLAARALAQESGILLLDEASASLDIARKMELYRLLAARNAAGVTILAALHDINLAALFCRRLVFLKDGRIEADGPTAEVFTQQTLSRIYETEIIVIAHPQTGTPQALAAGGSLPAGRPACGRPGP